MTSPRWLDYLPVEDLPEDPRNPKAHADDEIDASMDRFGYTEPVLLDERTGVLVAGHGRRGRLLARRAAGGPPPEGVTVADDGSWLVPVIRGWASSDDAEAAAYLVASNRLTERGGWSRDPLVAILSELNEGPGLSGTGYDEADLSALLELDIGMGDGNDEGSRPGASARRTLAERFVVPPFTVLDARQGYWKDRKSAWLALGIESEVGRSVDGPAEGEHALAGHRSTPSSASAADPAFYTKKRAVEEELGRELTTAEFTEHHWDGEGVIAATSVFDPVLCEVSYRWFSGPGAAVLDPFAGGSVRGVVAAALGRPYTGIDLRPEQVAANNVQWERVAPLLGPTPGLPGDSPWSPPPADDRPDETPIETHGGFPVKRDDLFRLSGSGGGKVRTCLHLATLDGIPAGLVTAGSRSSPQVNIVAHVARLLGVPCRVHVPAADGPLVAELASAVSAGAELVEHRPGYNTVIVARAREDAAERGWVEIPFGMECQAAVTQTAAQVANLPDDIERIVVPVGSGMSVSGVLTGLRAAGRTTPVLGVCVGADPTERLDEYAPADWRDQLTLVQSPADYGTPAPVRALGALPLDPYYEAKCLPYLQEGDLLWVVGIRETSSDAPPALAPPTWITGDSRDLDTLLPEGAEYDLLFSCPPYYDLEVYSDDPDDLSAVESYDEFLKLYREIITASCARLRDNRFAVWVVGEVRAPDGTLRGLVPDTIAAFADAGLSLQSDAVFLTPLGSLAIRAARGFTPARRLGRAHQYALVFTKGDPVEAFDQAGHEFVLVFAKGDPRAASVAAGPVEVSDPTDPLANPDVPPPDQEADNDR